MRPTPFKDAVYKIVESIPFGKVASYGQVAVVCGVPRAAIQVGQVLNKAEEHVDLPWWRVVNNAGRITIKGSHYTPDDQKVLLESEGLKINKKFEFAIEDYRWMPDDAFLKKLHLPEEYVLTLLRRFAI